MFGRPSYTLATGVAGTPTPASHCAVPLGGDNLKAHANQIAGGIGQSVGLVHILDQDEEARPVSGSTVHLHPSAP